METKNILRDLWDHVEDQKGKRKIAQRVFDYLNSDPMYSIQADEKAGVFWVELIGWTYGEQRLPRYAFNYIRRWANRRGLEYLYDKLPG